MAFALLALPLSAFDDADAETALGRLRGIVQSEGSLVQAFHLPNFKIGTLDGLVSLADELARLDTTCAAVVAKTGDALRQLVESDEARLAQNKLVNDKPTTHYVQSFSWNRARYRADKALPDLAATLQKELTTVDADLRAKMGQYSTAKGNLATLQRKQTGNLATRSLVAVVDPSALVTDSEYLETHLIAVPLSSRKEFLSTYESLAPMVVPRSAAELAADDEYALFSATTFRKTAPEFLAKVRDAKWTPRTMSSDPEARASEQRDLDAAIHAERKLWGDALRIARTSWGEAVMLTMHAATLRVFVEAVLRYGLPLDYSSALITLPKSGTKIREQLDRNFSYLAGNAVQRDKQGRVAKEEAGSEVATHGLEDYSAYVYYELEFP